METSRSSPARVGALASHKVGSHFQLRYRFIVRTRNSAAHRFRAGPMLWRRTLPLGVAAKRSAAMPQKNTPLITPFPLVILVTLICTWPEIFQIRYTPLVKLEIVSVSSTMVPVESSTCTFSTLPPR